MDCSAAVILATILIAVASAGVSIVLGISSILLNNFYLRLRPEASAKDRFASPASLSSFILLLTIAIINTGASDSFMQYTFLSMGLRCTVLFLPMGAALFLPGKVSPRFACAAIVAGPLVAADRQISPEAALDSIFFGLAVVTAVSAAGVLDQKRRVRV
jgi:SSS family solute:Na+ symporter